MDEGLYKKEIVDEARDMYPFNFKNVHVAWDASDDSYLLFVAGSADPVARFYAEELEQLEMELKRIKQEMSA